MYLASKKTYKKKATKTVSSTANKALRIAKSIDKRSYSSRQVGDSLNLGINTDPVGIRYIQPANGKTQVSKIVSISGKMQILSDLTTVLHDPWRVDLVLDRQPNKTTIDPTDVYNLAYGYTTALRNYDNSDRYKIVKSWGNVLTPDVISSRTINFKISSGLMVDGSEAGLYGIADLTKNAYYLLFRSDSTADPPLFTYELEIINLS